jgi:hypothetical protein
MYSAQVILSYMDSFRVKGHEVVTLKKSEWQLATSLASDVGWRGPAIRGSSMGAVAARKFASALQTSLSVTPQQVHPAQTCLSPAQARQAAASNPATRKKLEAVVALGLGGRGIQVTERRW